MAVFITANVVDASFPPSSLRSIDLGAIAAEGEAAFTTLRSQLAAGTLFQSFDGAAQYQIPNGVGQVTGAFTVNPTTGVPNFPVNADSAGGSFFSGTLFLVDGAFNFASNFSLTTTGTIEFMEVGDLNSVRGVAGSMSIDTSGNVTGTV